MVAMQEMEQEVQDVYTEETPGEVQDTNTLPNEGAERWGIGAPEVTGESPTDSKELSRPEIFQKVAQFATEQTGIICDHTTAFRFGSGETSSLKKKLAQVHIPQSPIHDIPIAGEVFGVVYFEDIRHMLSDLNQKTATEMREIYADYIVTQLKGIWTPLPTQIELRDRNRGNVSRLHAQIEKEYNLMSELYQAAQTLFEGDQWTIQDEEVRESWRKIQDNMESSGTLPTGEIVIFQRTASPDASANL